MAADTEETCASSRAIADESGNALRRKSGKPWTAWKPMVPDDDDCRVCAEVTLDPWVGRIAELVILKKLAPTQARAQAEEEYALDPDYLGRSLRIKLTGSISEALNKGSWPPQWVGKVKHPISDMVTDCELEDLFSLINFNPSKEELDEASLQEAAHEIITRFEQGAKSIAEVLAARRAQSEHAPSRGSEDGRSDNDKQSAPLRSEEELQAIERILSLCAGHDPEGIENWRKLISDKVKLEDLLAWEDHSDEDVRRIGRLIQGTMVKGLRDAIRIVERRIDVGTRLGTLLDHRQANGGRFEHFEGSFKILVTQLKDRML
jgi:hypothetical protein